MTPRRWLFGAAVAGGVVLHSQVLLAVFAGAAWTVCAYLWPYAPCWRCRGRKTNRGSTRKRFGSCRACKGSGSRQVIGSRSLHRAVRSGVRFRNERKGN